MPHAQALLLPQSDSCSEQQALKSPLAVSPRLAADGDQVEADLLEHILDSARPSLQAPWAVEADVEAVPSPSAPGDDAQRHSHVHTHTPSPLSAQLVAAQDDRPLHEDREIVCI